MVFVRAIRFRYSANIVNRKVGIQNMEVNGKSLHAYYTLCVDMCEIVQDDKTRWERRWSVHDMMIITLQCR